MDLRPQPTAVVKGYLGRFRLLGAIAEGGMGIVYLAVVNGPGGFHKLFAVKELKRDLALDAGAVMAFLREAKLAASLSHANIAQTLEVGSQGDQHYMAMEYLEGEGLDRVAARGRALNRPLPVNYALTIVAAALDGLHYAHTLSTLSGAAAGFVHRDVSPQNLRITYDGQTKLLDFGIAKAADSAQHTRSGVIKGKVRYMAPEQALGEVVDGRADVFAACVVLAELIAGRSIWPAEHTTVDIIRDLVSGNMPSMQSFAPDAPPEVRAIIAKSIVAQRESRYESALAMRNDIESCLASLPEGKCGPREIAAYMSELFADERRATRARIEQQLQQCAAETPSTEWVSSYPYPERGAQTVTASLSETQDYSAITGAQRTAGMPRRSPSGRRLAWIAGGLLLCASAIGGYASWSAPRAVPEEMPRGASSAAADLELSISAQPASARLSLDGRALGGNPEVALLRRATVAVQIRAEADGYEAQELHVIPDRARAVVLTLRPIAPPSPPASAAPAPPVSSPKAPRPSSRHSVAPGPSPAVVHKRPKDLEPF